MSNTEENAQMLGKQEAEAMQQTWNDAQAAFGNQVAFVLVVVEDGPNYRLVHGGRLAPHAVAAVLEEQVRSLRGAQIAVAPNAQMN